MNDHTLTPDTAAQAILEGLEAGEGVASLLVISEDGHEGGTSALTGHRMVMTSSWSRGGLGDRVLTEAARELGGERLRDPRSEGAGLHLIPMGAGKEAEIYLEIHRPLPELWIVGAGHIGQSLAAAASLLGFQVSVLDDRSDFVTAERFPSADRLVTVDFSDPFAHMTFHKWTHVVLVTRGHRFDYECLRRILKVDPFPTYLGMIGSQRRVRATFAQLLEEGIPRERLAAVHAPIGLDLGSETPAEIAISVAAELVLSARGGTGAPLGEMVKVLDRFFKEETDE
jgi:xanthine dehydrogenase accessory factor